VRHSPSSECEIVRSDLILILILHPKEGGFNRRSYSDFKRGRRK
jgi:hypothetical protein